MESLGYELCSTSLNHFQFVYVILLYGFHTVAQYSRFFFETVSLSLSHWYNESGVVLDCIDI